MVNIVKKLVVGSIIFVLLLSNVNLSYAANNDILFKESKKNTISDIDFNKKSYIRTEEQIKKDQELKNTITPFEKLNPKNENSKSGNIPQGWKPGDEFGQPKGTNQISFGGFDYGDIILVHDGVVAWGYYRHVGMWDSDFYNGSIYDKCIWEANVDPTNDVHRASPQKFRNYDYAVGLWVALVVQDVTVLPFLLQTKAENRIR